MSGCECSWDGLLSRKKHCLKEVFTHMWNNASLVSTVHFLNLFSSIPFCYTLASMGLVGVMPQQMGYGESAKVENGALVPSILDPKSKTTSTLPLYAKAKSIVAEMSDGRTVVGDEAYFLG